MEFQLRKGPEDWSFGRRKVVVAVIILILLMTLFPFAFHFGSGAADQGHLLNPVVARADAAHNPVDFVSNCVLFFPLGMVLSAAWLRSRRSLKSILTAGLACFLLSAMIEILQTGLPSRSPAAADIVANTLGGLLGSGLARLMPDLVRSLLRQLRSLLLVIARGCVVVPLLIVHTIAAGLLIQYAVSQSSLASWSPDYHLMLGNEATGNRPWRGDLGPIEFRVEGRTLLDLGEPAAAFLHPSGPAAVPMVWQETPPETEPASLSLQLIDGAWLMSSQPMTALSETVRQANRFTLALTVMAVDTLQHGPARIISLSRDPWHRNLTLGQNGSSLVVRLRTPFSGENGTDPALVIDDCLTPGQVQRLEVKYNGRRLTVRDDHGRILGRLELRYGAAVCRGSFRFNYHDQEGYLLMYYAMLFLPVVFLAVLWWWRRRFALSTSAICDT